MNGNEADPRRAGQDYVLGPDGKPLTDRYGRPIRRRPAAGVPLSPPQAGRPSPPRPRTPRQQPPRQQPPRQQPPGQQPSGQQPPRQAGPPSQGYQPRTPGWQSQGQQQQGYQPRANYQQQPAAPRGYPPQPGYQQPPAAAHATRHAQPVVAGGHRRAKRSNPIATGLGCTGVAILALIVALVLMTLWADTKLTRNDALDYPHVANTPGTNWLLVGSDSRQGLTEEQQLALGTGGDVGAGRTDTIMLLHIPRKGSATLVSIPRDSYVDIPGFGMDKINAAFAFGGAPLLGQTIEQWSGLRIDRYAEIGMGGLANVVDSIGGVDLCVQEPIQDPLAGIDLQAGCQTLQGHDALGYARTRATALGDLDRVARQRELFTALREKIFSFGTLGNPFRLFSLIDHTASSFVVGNGDHVWNLVRVATAMGDDVKKVTVPVDGFADTEVGNVVLWNDAETAALWDSLKR
ncbi:LytR family transcriptional regulator [Corynebacterium phocae]|uniref:LytR family transcriptional regulator n=1 Tax=Corynebacterium phocae TaxID=161895 RepID=A0A1L7D5M3_9CORY|nr:LCP family protein [Corynebacterium phocae]APT93439.1 LytR family transcriptional regulator [Corynebacterium phocae]KAA8721133.1 LytR family transcriptional regulator [Corynebacterium phocae]